MLRLHRPGVGPIDGTDLLAVRVHNAALMGGIWLPVHVVLSDQGADVNLQLRSIWAMTKSR